MANIQFYKIIIQKAYMVREHEALSKESKLRFAILVPEPIPEKSTVM